MSDQVTKIRAWAEDQLASLQRQRDGIDRKMADFQGFLVILKQTPSAFEDYPAGKGEVNGSGKGDADSFPGRVAAILREHSTPTHPMTTAQIVGILERDGFKPDGKSSIKIRVSTELARQAAKKGHGIRRVGPGLYTA